MSACKLQQLRSQHTFASAVSPPWWPFLAERQSGQLEVVASKTTPACIARACHLCKVRTPAKVVAWLYNFNHWWGGKIQKKIILAQHSLPKEPHLGSCISREYKDFSFLYLTGVNSFTVSKTSGGITLSSPTLLIVIPTCWGPEVQKIAQHFCKLFSHSFLKTTQLRCFQKDTGCYMHLCVSQAWELERGVVPVRLQNVPLLPAPVVWRGDLYADRPGQSGISVADFLATPWRQNSSFCWSMTRHLRSKTHYAKIWVSFILKWRCSCLQTPFMLPEWSWLLVAIISVLSVWYTAWQVAENAHLHMFYNSNTRGHQAADHAVKKSNGLCSEHTSSWEGCSQIRYHFCTVSFPWAWSLGLGFFFVCVSIVSLSQISL